MDLQHAAAAAAAVAACSTSSSNILVIKKGKKRLLAQNHSNNSNLPTTSTSANTIPVKKRTKRLTIKEELIDIVCNSNEEDKENWDLTSCGGWQKKLDSNTTTTTTESNNQPTSISTLPDLTTSTTDKEVIIQLKEDQIIILVEHYKQKSLQLKEVILVEYYKKKSLEEEILVEYYKQKSLQLKQKLIDEQQTTVQKLNEITTKTKEIVNHRSQELYKLLELEFNCSICEEIYIQATVTTCGHTYCKYCITEWTEKKKRDCPICRKAIVQLANHIEIENLITKLCQLLPEELLETRQQILRERVAVQEKGNKKKCNKKRNSAASSSRLNGPQQPSTSAAAASMMNGQMYPNTTNFSAPSSSSSAQSPSNYSSFLAELQQFYNKIKMRMGTAQI